MKRNEQVTSEALTSNQWGEYDIQRTIQTTQLEKTKEPKESIINSSEQVREITSTRTEKQIRR